MGPESMDANSSLDREESPISEQFADITEPVTRRPTNIELARVESLRLQQKSTVGSTTGPAPRSEWLAFGDGKDYPALLPDPEKYVVGFDGADDPTHPHNWPTTIKYVPPPRKFNPAQR